MLLHQTATKEAYTTTQTCHLKVKAFECRHADQRTDCYESHFGSGTSCAHRRGREPGLHFASSNFFTVNVRNRKQAARKNYQLQNVQSRARRGVHQAIAGRAGGPPGQATSGLGQVGFLFLPRGSMKFNKIDYENLNARQKEVFNFHKIAAMLADYGFNCLKLTDDWQGADFLAYQMLGNKETLKN